jgi:hypothetical protein
MLVSSDSSEKPGPAGGTRSGAMSDEEWCAKVFSLLEMSRINRCKAEEVCHGELHHVMLLCLSPLFPSLIFTLL